MGSQEKSPMTLSLDQLNCQVATKNIHWGFQPDSSVPFCLRAPGHLDLEPNQDVWSLYGPTVENAAEKKPLWDAFLKVCSLGVFFS